MLAARIGLATIAIVMAGCAHQVTFEKPAPYTVAGSRHQAGVTAVIDRGTRETKVSIQSMMTGAAHDWQVEAGDMLKQVADIELPQMFARYELVEAYKEPPGNEKWIALELKLPSYKFEDFRAKVAITATVYERGMRRVSQKTYIAEGEGQGGKMFFGGAFAMKSAIRQSSLDAFKKVFEQLRADLPAVVPR